jgi:hypothetical protein
MRLAQTVVLCLILGVFASPGRATDANAKPKTISIEFNALAQVQGACRLSFVVRNGLAKAINEIVLELVLFNKQNQVAKLLAINPGRLLPGKTRVKQFDVKATACGDIRRLLLNDVQRCKGDGLSPNICLEALVPSSRLDVPFIN